MYQLYHDVLGERVNRDLYQLALAKEVHFTHSKTSPNMKYPDWRRSKVIYEDQLGGVTALFEHLIRGYLPRVRQSLHIPEFDVASMEIQLTSHNDGEYYHWHTDNNTPPTASRAVTFVYYFHALPKRFGGGELVIYGPEGATSVIEPANDTLVFFDSGTRHEVKPVSCPTKRFEDGRFTLNGWVRRRAVVRTDDYFDHKIFSVPAHSASGGSTRREERLHLSTHLSGTSNQREAVGHAPDDGVPSGALLHLYSDLYRHSRRAQNVDVVPAITGEEFFENYYYANRPCVVKGMMRASPAVRTWSPTFFAERYGSEPVQITMQRNADADYEVNFARTVRTVKLSDFVQRIEAEPQSNDFYLVARNYFFDNPTFRPLRNDLQPPQDIVDTDDDRQGVVKLWLGPKGTVTPLHYDEHSILLCQIFGRKHFKLIPSFDAPKLYVRRRFYSAVDPERVDGERYPAFLQASVVDVSVEPGDVLFLPVGWWHWAKALDISISATFCSFRVPGRNTMLGAEMP